MDPSILTTLATISENLTKKAESGDLQISKYSLFDILANGEMFFQHKPRIKWRYHDLCSKYLLSRGLRDIRSLSEEPLSLEQGLAEVKPLLEKLPPILRELVEKVSTRGIEFDNNKNFAGQMIDLFSATKFNSLTLPELQGVQLLLDQIRKHILSSIFKKFDQISINCFDKIELGDGHSEPFLRLRREGGAELRRGVEQELSDTLPFLLNLDIYGACLLYTSDAADE